ncbi:nucleotide exchange factor SIL1 isoform X2 [Cylas formicarius]|uniref:nucleotide exchange factor SIL1 isoform X2 n=1 Tax=Cylas formicarius TaxID=197179 RepID=UPI002958488C|nr:nucleotide exchange factor SIL1 isoform X2 [Cylas formicarius]
MERDKGRLEKSQKVPSGLHYRINLSTGKKEAKIIQQEDEPSKNTFTLVEKDKPDRSQTPSAPNKNNWNFKVKESRKFRSYEELKKEIGDLNLIPQSDAELLGDLFQEYDLEIKKREQSPKVIIAIIKDLIFLSHQFDNANEFVRLDGFNRIVYKSFNSSNSEIKQEALKLFSSLVQNNAKVKVHALENGAISILLKTLNLEPSPQIKHSTITALSCLLRTFPYAQNSFLENGGLKLFSNIFQSNSLELNIKLKLKLATLISDLLSEREFDEDNFKGHTAVDLADHLRKLNWCENLNKLLQDLIQVDIEDHDAIEKCLVAMGLLGEKCIDKYNQDIIVGLYKRYNSLINETEDDASYFKELRDLCLLLSTPVHQPSNLKSEL